MITREPRPPVRASETAEWRFRPHSLIASLADGFVVVRALFCADEMVAASAEADRLFARSDLIDTKSLRCCWQDHCGICESPDFPRIISGN
jgi:hypothetical protein